MQLSKGEEVKRNQVESMIEDLLEGNGLWNLEDLEHETKLIKTKGRRVKILKAQINMWTNIWQ